MSFQIKVAVSILAADFSRLATALKMCEDSGADIIHLDIMDGHFAPNITFGPFIVRFIRQHTRLFLEAHLMIENPTRYLKDFILAGSDMITLHSECYGDLINPTEFPKVIQQIKPDKVRQDIEYIKSQGKKVALALNPDTPVCIQELLSELDLVLIMSVNPGFAGQKFREDILPKISVLRQIYPGDIAVDGGINDRTAKLALQAGANILVTASYFFQSPDPYKAIRLLKEGFRSNGEAGI